MWSLAALCLFLQLIYIKIETKDLEGIYNDLKYFAFKIFPDMKKRTIALDSAI